MEQQQQLRISTTLILSSECRTTITTDEDRAFPSKVAREYTKGAVTALLWQLNYTFDRFKAAGDKGRSFYKWCHFLQELVGRFRAPLRAVMMPEEEADLLLLHFRQVGHPPEALPDSAASSLAIMTFYFAYVEHGRNQNAVNAVVEWVKLIGQRAADSLHGAVSLPVPGMVDLSVSGGVVDGVVATLSSWHKTAVSAWAKEWNAMHAAGQLGMSMAERGFGGNEGAVTPVMLLSDFIIFLLTVNRVRRQSNKGAWSQDKPTGRALYSMQMGMISWLARRLDSYVYNVYSQHHDVVGRLPPARDMKPRSSCGKRRTSMSAEAIWELLQMRNEVGISVRDSLKAHGNRRLSQTGGATPGAHDSWTRKLLSMYDDRVTNSLAGATQFNLVADGSTHAGGAEILISLLWCRENSSGAFCNIQQLVPGKVIDPEELEMPSVIERMAQETDDCPAFPSESHCNC